MNMLCQAEVQVPTFEWVTFEILGYGGHKYVFRNVEIFITDESSTFKSYPPNLTDEKQQN